MAAKRKVRMKISVKEREQIRRLTLMDNDFMNIALENNIECVQTTERSCGNSFTICSAMTRMRCIFLDCLRALNF